MFMWLQPFPWPSTTRPCLGRRTCARLCLTGSGMERYAQKGDNIGFFSNVAKVLPPAGFVEDHNGPSWG